MESSDARASMSCETSAPKTHVERYPDAIRTRHVVDEDARHPSCIIRVGNRARVARARRFAGVAFLAPSGRRRELGRAPAVACHDCRRHQTRDEREPLHDAKEVG